MNERGQSLIVVSEYNQATSSSPLDPAKSYANYGLEPRFRLSMRSSQAVVHMYQLRTYGEGFVIQTGEDFSQPNRKGFDSISLRLGQSRSPDRKGLNGQILWWHKSVQYSRKH